MAKYRGSKGFIAIGGIVTGSPLVQGAVAQTETSATFDATSLTGVVLAGDTFTVDGDAQTYTVTADALVTANAVAVTFTPAVQEAAGWADNAPVTFTANSLAQVTAFDITPSRPVIDSTAMGDTGMGALLDQPTFSGTVTVQLDYADTEQANLVDEVTSNTDVADLGAVFGLATDKQLYGHIATAQGAITSQRGSLVTVALTVQGKGALSRDW